MYLIRTKESKRKCSNTENMQRDPIAFLPWLKAAVCYRSYWGLSADCARKLSIAVQHRWELEILAFPVLNPSPDSQIPDPKCMSKILVQNPSSKSHSQMPIPNPSPKCHSQSPVSQIPIPNPGQISQFTRPKSTSKIPSPKSLSQTDILSFPTNSSPVLGRERGQILFMC